MARLYHATGIVLSRRDRREADRWYTAFTKDQGKIEFLARGAHKPLAKLAAHLETPAEVELLLVDGRHYLTVAGVERRRAFSQGARSYQTLLLGKSALHLVDIGTRTHERDERLYALLVDWLSFLDVLQEVTAERAGYLLGSFALKLLAVTGYRPQLRFCLACQQGIQENRHRWHALKGGVVCEACAHRNQEEWFSVRTISDETVKLLRFSLEHTFEDQLKTSLPGPVLAEYHDTLESLIVSHFPTIPGNSIRATCLV